MAKFFMARWLQSILSPKKAKTYRRRPTRRSLLVVEHLEERLAPANNFVWTGLGATANWSDNNNWQGNVAPTGLAANKEDLVFGPQGTTRLTNIDNIAGGTFNSITISNPGYDLKGSVQLTLGDQFTTGSGFVIMNAGSGAAAQIEVNMTLSGPAGDNQFFTINSGNTLTINAKLSGNSGSTLSKEGTGTLRLVQDNSSFTGNISVDVGILTAENNFRALGDDRLHGR